MSPDQGAPTPAYIGVGSNLYGPEEQVERAIDALSRTPESELGARSSLYQSAPFGPVDQPDFVNAVVRLVTKLDAPTLLHQLQQIENSQGRIRGEHWGPRVIDLDLLVFGDMIVDLDDLKVPHPGIAERNFVLLPLQEIARDLVIPGLGRVVEIAVNRDEPRITLIR
ncbi:MAG: 2-amino-4-hydroxy-6-hydroxymethyldihydropteridine diphosphokinase [Woeseiaceae bacterium]|nr:2-amino-4-hydroxy-6-hydroxymethyldihydropteridine diphosphokinase [Woeseiaceae bacterium]